MKALGGHLVVVATPEVKLFGGKKPAFVENQHPRDRHGKFIEIGGTVSLFGGGTGTVLKDVGNGRVEVRMDHDGSTRVLDASLTTQIRSAAQNANRPGHPIAPEAPGAPHVQHAPTAPGSDDQVSPPGATHAPDASPHGAVAHLRTPDGSQAAWLRNDEGKPATGYVRTDTHDPNTTHRFDDSQAWADHVDAQGMQPTDQVPPAPGQGRPAEPAPDAHLDQAGAASSVQQPDAETASPQAIRSFIEDGIGPVSTFRDGGGDGKDRPDSAGLAATWAADKQAKNEIAADLTDRMDHVPDEHVLAASDVARLERINNGDVVLVRGPGTRGLEGQRFADKANPTVHEQLNEWDYREVPTEKFNELVNSGHPFPPGLERVTAEQWRGWKRNERISGAVALWAQQSNGTNPTALALQETAADLFGMQDHADWPGFDDYPDLRAETDAAMDRDRPFNEAFLLAQYDATQDRFRAHGITELQLHRGFRTYADSPDWTAADGPADVPLRPMSSFSADEKLAGSFARDFNGNEGVVISATVPVERILSTPRTGSGCLSESEFIVLAGPGQWNVRRSGDTDGPPLPNQWNPTAAEPDVPDSPTAPVQPSGLPTGLLATRADLAAAVAAADDPQRRGELIERARVLGMSDLIPGNWTGDGRAEPPTHPDWMPDLTVMDEKDLITAVSTEISKNDTVAQQMVDAARAELLRRADVLAGALLEKYGAVEPGITKELTEAAKAAGGQMSGLSNRMKKRPSLARKLRDKSIDKGITQEEYSNKIGDAVRYTMLVKPEKYSETTNQVLDSFRAQGMTVTADNTWLPGSVYKGVNCEITTPNGTTFELQFHTAQSFDVKRANHADYEAMRDPAKSVEERYAAYRRMAESWRDVKVPKGIETVGTPLDRGNPFADHEAALTAAGTPPAPIDHSPPPPANPSKTQLGKMSEADLVSYVAMASKGGQENVTAQAVAGARDELTRRAEVVADQLLVKYRKVEPTITKIVTEAATAAGGRMEGLQYRLKEKDSLARKLRDKSIDKGMTQEQYGQKINDAVRYTMLVDPDNYAAASGGLLDKFKADGYEIVAADNTWVPGQIYKGINCTLRAPDGTLFELQFHTPDSLRVKEGQHDDYETMRDPAQSIGDRYAAYMKMKNNWDHVTTPPGVESVGNVTAKPSPFTRQEEAAGKDAADAAPKVPATGTSHAPADQATTPTPPAPPVPVPGTPGSIDDQVVPPATPDDGAIGTPDRPIGGAWEHADDPRFDTPSSKYGMTYEPSAAADPLVRQLKGDDAAWDGIPSTDYDTTSGNLIATEELLRSKPIDKVVGGAPFREGYDPRILRTDHGDIVIDGHHRVAMYNALKRKMPAKIIDISGGKPLPDMDSSGTAGTPKGH